MGSKKKGTSRAKRSATAPKYCEWIDAKTGRKCGYDKIVQRHRIEPGREGGKYTLGNVIALCPNHHAEADRDWVSRDELREMIRERVEEANEENSEQGNRPSEEPGSDPS